MPICQKELLHALVISIGSFTFGNILGFPGPAKSLILAENQMVVENPFLFDLYNSASSLFALIGPWILQLLFGLFKGSRKKALLVVAIYTSCCWFLLLLTKVNIWAGIVMRALLGIGLGMNSGLCPMYMFEIAPDDAKGFYGSLSQVAVVFGFVWVNIISPSLNSYMKMIYISGSWVAFQAICIPFIVESPAFEREKEYREKNETGEKEKLFQKKYAKPLTLGVILMFVQQFSGLNAILTNLNELMTVANLNFHPDYQSAIVQLAQFVAVIIGSFIMDCLGRRVVWIISTSFMLVFIMIYALYDRFKWNTNVIPLISIFFYEFGFGIGAGPIPWFIVPEYFPESVRTQAQAIISSCSWIFSFIVVLSFPTMSNDKNLHLWGALLLYLGVIIFGLIFGIFMIHDPTIDNENAKSIDDNSKDSSIKSEDVQYDEKITQI